MRPQTVDQRLKAKRFLFFKSTVYSLLSVVFFFSSVFAATPVFDTDQTYNIDTFSKEGINTLGHSSKVIVPPNANVRVSLNTRETINQGGRSLEIMFWLFGNNEISWESGLDPLNLGKAECLMFWFKGTPLTDSGVWVQLSDRKGQAKDIPIRAYLGNALPEKNGFRLVSIPRTAFGDVNFRELKSLKISIRSGFLGLGGQVFLDDVSFAGPKDLLFESLKENLYGFPKTVSAPERKNAILKLNDQAMLREIAKDTWKYFDNLVDQRSGLPIDHVKLDDKRFLGDYTSPTNIGLYLIACVGAYHLNLISREKVVARIDKTLDTLGRLKQYRNFFFNYYNTTYLEPTSTFISSVDNAWLAASLVIVRSAFSKELSKKTSSLLNRMDFDFFYDPGVGQMSLGYDTAKKELLNFHYSMLATEARIISLIAIGKHDVPREHWFQLYRTPPAQWKWQTQSPKEKDRKLTSFEVRTGFYTYKKRRFVPSWGGSLFEFLMPTLVVPEKRWSPEALCLNDKIVSEIHRDYALKERKYPVWGISPCSVSRGKSAIYGEFGIKALGVKGYNDAGVVTPHVGFLALDSTPADAVKNIREFLRRYDIYGEYGLYDSVQTRGGVVTRQYLALDQGMTFIALANYLNNGSIQQLFANDEIGKEVKDLLREEDFF
ncbi:MAG: DUF3131 domain-containing protein [Candidatus Omnitrophica bacterium]|nr:DUF3131 domain-containing protein [Candidatus Omnitrophota bacterium]